MIAIAVYSSVRSKCVVGPEFLIIVAIGMFFGVLLSLVFNEVKSKS